MTMVTALRMTRITKPEKEEIVREKFKDTDINITKDGKNTLEQELDQDLTCLNMSMKKWVDG